MAQLNRYRNKEGLIWLNVASSARVIKDFANIDNHVFVGLSRLPPFITRPLPKKYRDSIEAYRNARAVAPLLKHDCRKRLPLPDNVADHILCSHFLEHVYPHEAVAILKDFHRVLKPGATLHVIVPDIAGLAEDYIQRKNSGDAGAADAFVGATLLTTASRGSLKFRVLEGLGSFGLQHRWMYDHLSLRAKVVEAGFDIAADNETPSRDYRENDDSVHIVARKVER